MRTCEKKMKKATENKPQLYRSVTNKLHFKKYIKNKLLIYLLFFLFLFIYLFTFQLGDASITWRGPKQASQHYLPKPAEAARTIREPASSCRRVEKVWREINIKRRRAGWEEGALLGSTKDSRSVSGLVSSACPWWKVRRQTGPSCFYRKKTMSGMVYEKQYRVTLDPGNSFTGSVHPVSRNSQD